MKNTGMRFKLAIVACAAAALMGFGLFAQASDDISSAEVSTQAVAAKDFASEEKAAADKATTKKQEAAQLEAAANAQKAEKAEAAEEAAEAAEPEKAESAESAEAPEEAAVVTEDKEDTAEDEALVNEAAPAPAAQENDEADASADEAVEQASSNGVDEPADEAPQGVSEEDSSATATDGTAEQAETPAASGNGLAAEDASDAADATVTPADDAAALAAAAVQEDPQERVQEGLPEEAETETSAAEDKALLKTQSGSSITNAKVIVYGKDFWPERGTDPADIFSSVVSGDPSRYTVTGGFTYNEGPLTYSSPYNYCNYELTVTPVAGYTLDAQPTLVWVGQNANQPHAASGYCVGKTGNSYKFVLFAALEYLQEGVPIPKPQVVTVTYYNRFLFNEGEITSFDDLKSYISSVTYEGYTYSSRSELSQITIRPALFSAVSPGENRFYVSLPSIGVPDYSYDAACSFYVIQTPTMTLDTYGATKSYRVGDTLDTTNLTVRVSGGSEDPVSGLSRVIDLDDVNISVSGETGTNLTTAGTKTVTVTYNCPAQTINASGALQSTTKLVSASYDITVKDISSIAVSEPGTVEYQYGDELDTSNTKLTVTYTDGSTEDVAVESSMVSGFDSSKAGSQTLTVSYEGKTATYDVTVAAQPEEEPEPTDPGNTDPGNTDDPDATEEPGETDKPDDASGTGKPAETDNADNPGETPPAGATESTSASSSSSSSSSSTGDKPDYSILEGANSVWNVGATGDVVIRGSGDFSKFVRVLVDGVAIDPANYSVASGSTIVTLKASYLATLPEGAHNFEIEWTDGAAATVFTVTQAALSGDDDDDADDDVADDDSDTATATSAAGSPSSSSSGKKGEAKVAPARQSGTVATSDPVFWLVMLAVAASAAGVLHTARRIRQADARFASWLN